MKQIETSQQQQAIKDAFLRCLAAESTQLRDEQLAQIDREVAAEVRALLGSAEAGQVVDQVFEFVSDPQSEETGTSHPRPSAMSNIQSASLFERVGTVIGPYKLLEQIGEGGMGAVFMAQQTQPIKRKVALKVIRPGMDTGQAVARFEAERQALAMMDHPNIARVLDAGTTEHGRPYFAMELVRGVPITEYCAGQKLSTEDRLKLFIDVCQGVQHAHQKGIIHRDLKPNNVLITLHDGKPVPKIIDFGIAKAMNQDLTDRTLFTNFAQMIGTPLYMSPEQAAISGLDIDTRSDVYSLGVLLYELLTGTTPFDRETLKKVGIDEIRRMIRETEPPRPSQRLSTLKARTDSTLGNLPVRDLKRSQLELRGELDWIVMKALEKERERRYQTAIALAADVERYLNDEPVLACPPSVAYRLKKFSRRYRAAIATAAGLFLALVVATGISIRYAYVADGARRESEAERESTNAQRILTEDALCVAEDERQVAEQQRQLAESRRLESQELEHEAIRQRDAVRRNLYIADIRLAAIDFKSGNIARLHAKLNEQIPAAGEPDFRGWEWYYLQASSHQEIRTMFALENYYTDWSPDGTKIASIGNGTTARIWDASDGTPLHTLDLETTWNCGGVWSPDSRYLAWTMQGNEAGTRIWDSESKTVKTLYWVSSSKGDNVFCVAWSPDGKRLATGAGKGVLRIWEVESGNELHRIETDCGSIWSVAWSPDGEQVATAAGGIRIWNTDSGEMDYEIGRGRSFRCVTFSSDGRTLVAGDTSGKCDIISTKTKLSSHQFDAHRGEVSDIAIDPTGMSFATAGVDGSIHTWSLPDARGLSSYVGHEGPVRSISWSPDGQFLLSGSEDYAVKVWPVTRTTVAAQGNEAVPAMFLDLQSNVTAGEAIRNATGAAPDDDRIRKYLELSAKGALPRPTRGQVQDSAAAKRLFNVVWSQDYSKCITVRSAKAGSRLDLWDAQSGTNTFLWVSRNGVYDIRWAPDNTRVAIASEPQWGAGFVAILETDDGVEIVPLVNEYDATTAVAWNHDGTRIATGNRTGRVSVWDSQTRQLIASYTLHRSKVTSVAFAAGEDRLVCVCADGDVRIIDALTCEELIGLGSENPLLRRGEWSGDHRKLAGVDINGKLTIWDASIGYAYADSDALRHKMQLLALNEASTARSQRSSVRLVSTIDNIRKSIGSVAYVPKSSFEDGKIELQNGRYSEAVELFTKAIQVDPENDLWPRIYRAKAYLELDEFAKAIEDLLSVFNGTNSSYAFHLPGVYVATGDFESANTCLARMLDLADKSSITHERQRAVYGSFAPHISTENLERVLLLAKSLHAEEARNPETGRWIGYTLYSLGRYEEAVTFIAASTDPVPNLPSAVCWYHMAMVQQQLGQHDLAVEWLAKANAESDNILASEIRPEWRIRIRLVQLRESATQLIMGDSDAAK